MRIWVNIFLCINSQSSPIIFAIPYLFILLVLSVLLYIFQNLYYEGGGINGSTELENAIAWLRIINFHIMVHRIKYKNINGLYIWWEASDRYRWIADKIFSLYEVRNIQEQEVSPDTVVNYKCVGEVRWR